jgi:MurNAc alpha-1-phosphate uridylyltransferase
MFPVAILAGGLATRLRPTTLSIPKSLVDIAGEPFIGRQLRLLATSGIERVVICLGHLGAMIEEFVGDGRRYGVRADFSFDGARLLGTAGALKRASPLLDDDFFVLYGDSYVPCDFAAVQRRFIESERSALMTVFRNAGRYDASNVNYIDGSIVAYDKRKPTPDMQHIDYGLGILSKETLGIVPEGEPYDLADLYRILLSKGDVAACEISERFYEIGSANGLAETVRYFEDQDVKGLTR